MESDDDFDHFIPTGDSPSQIEEPKLKRLKRAKTKHVSASPPLPPHDSEFSFLDRVLNFTDPDDQQLQSPFGCGSGSGGSDEGANESDSIDSLLLEEKRPAVKRALGFDDDDDEADGFDEIRDELLGVVAGRRDSEIRFQDEEKRLSFGGSDDDVDEEKRKKKKKRGKGADQVKPKMSMRKVKQERKAHVVEYQRQLRERRDMEFKHVPLVRKSISSVLEKIRLRRMEILKNSSQSKDQLREIMLDKDSDDVPAVDIMEHRHVILVSEEVAQSSIKGDTTVSSLVGGPDEGTPNATHRPSKLSESKPTKAFWPPVSSTQDLFSDSVTGEIHDDLSNDESGEAVEDDFAPSLLAMDLKLDSALLDDMSSDEEDNNKENIKPSEEILQKGDPVKKFIDEEAEEENDSDDDLLCFDDEEEDNDDDDDDLNDIIATNYSENPIDFAKRNELHQMWLEQQDGAGTENLLQRLKCGPKLSDVISSSEGEEDGQNVDGENDEFEDDETEDEGPLPNAARMSIRKLKQMIPQMFTDKDEGYLSSDDEETEKMLNKQHLIEKMELEGLPRCISPAKDQASCEVHGRIKKLNILPETRRKAITSVLDTLRTKGSSSSPAKASFLSRAPKHPVSSINRRGVGSVKSFIFARDDSNSRSSTSMLEDTTDVNQNENQSKSNASAKFTSSQTALSCQRTQAQTEETASGALLFDILRGSSAQTRHCARDSMANGDAVFAAFKTVKRSVKLESRT